jgi:membrane protease YdiL (CAAX protease family)
MLGTHLTLDHIFVAAILVFSVVEWRWLWPRMLRAITAGVPNARLRAYHGAIVSEWLFMACIIVAWAVQDRSWAVFRLGPGSPLRLGLGLMLAATVVCLLWLQRRAIFARQDRVGKVRQKLGFADPLLPHTPAEHINFMLLAVTAGICEEVIFRGFVMWYFAVWTGPLLAAIFSSVVFGFGHIYLGLAHVPRTALVGAIFAFLVLATGSIWPAIIIHAAVDLHSGELGFRILGRVPTMEPSVVAQT